MVCYDTILIKLCSVVVFLVFPFVLFFFYCYGHHRDLHVLTHSFPTRRSSDLCRFSCSLISSNGGENRRSVLVSLIRRSGTVSRNIVSRPFSESALVGSSGLPIRWSAGREMPLRPAMYPSPKRSEEHTSELQSLMRISYAVFCLKKKKKPQNTMIYTKHTTNEARRNHNKST